MISMPMDRFTNREVMTGAIAYVAAVANHADVVWNAPALKCGKRQRAVVYQVNSTGPLFQKIMNQPLDGLHSSSVENNRCTNARLWRFRSHVRGSESRCCELSW